MAADLLFAFKQVADEHDGERNDGAEADPLQRPKDEEPTEVRCESHGRSEDPEDHETSREQQAPAIEIGDDAKDRRQHNRRRGEQGHDQRQCRVADAEGYG